MSDFVVDVGVRDRLAELEHMQWAHWTKYMLENLTLENVSKWLRQTNTPYKNLNEKEKDGDREWAGRVLAIIEQEGYAFEPAAPAPTMEVLE